jgi:hypothetical protein
VVLGQEDSSVLSVFLGQKGSMGRRVLLISLVLLVAGLGYAGYHSYDAKRAGASGDVFSPDGSIGKKASLERGKEISVTSSEEASSDGENVANSADSQQSSETNGSSANSTPKAIVAQVTQSDQAAPAAAPGSDTISPNPPNGMTFAGAGRYQLYRQGNLTWRLDTDTGQSCVLFATDEEWKKPRVYRAGCGRH